MTVTASSTATNPSHHIKLSDGTTDIGLILANNQGMPDARGFQRNITGQPIKMYTGDAKYDDGEPPWTSISMTDFSGGFGARNFDDDKSRYWFGKRAYTADGKFGIGPQSMWSTVDYGNIFWPHHEGAGSGGTGITYIWHQLTVANPDLCVKLKITATITPVTLYFITYTLATGTGPALSAKIYTDSGGPSTVCGTGATNISYQDIMPYNTKEIKVTIAPGELTAGTYWLVFNSGAAGTDRVSILCASQSSVGLSNVYYGTVGGTITAITTYKPFFYLATATSDYCARYFEYKGALFTVLNFDAAFTNMLFLNGDIGVANGGSTTTLTATAAGHMATWANDAAIGGICILTKGTGSNQQRNFRIIEANGTTGTPAVVTFSFTGDPWEIAPSTDTEFAIVGTDKWTRVPITTVSWDAPIRVTDVLSVNGVVYFAHGDAKAMTRMIMLNNAGTWTTTFADEDAAALGTKLCPAHDGEGQWIWKAKGTYPSNIAKAPMLDHSTADAGDLVWEAEFWSGDVYSRVTNMLQYGEYGNLHVMKENDIMQVINTGGTDFVYRIPISGFPPSKDWRNGRAACVHDSYLMFSWHDTIMRYLNNYVDNIGPNTKDTQLPDNYRGIISAMRSYPGMLYVSIDGGKSNFSSILGYNGTGWNLLYTSPTVNCRIENIFIQSLPGDNCDRLWYDCGGQLGWIPINTNPFFAPYVPYNFYNQAHTAELEFGRVYGGREKLYKYFKRLEFSPDKAVSVVAAGNTTFTNGYSVKLYVIRNGTYGEYITYLGTYDCMETGGDSGEAINIGVTDKYIRPFVILSEGTNYRKLRLNSLVIDSATFEKAKFLDSITFVVEDDAKDLNNDYDDTMTAATKLAKLEEWSGLSSAAPTVLTMSSMIQVLDNKSVFIASGSVKLIGIRKDDMEQKYIGQLLVYEL